jgi:hypothetical protein
MATARETINLAFRKLKVVGRGANPTSAETTDALDDLNAMMLDLWDGTGGFPFQNVRVDSAYEVSSETLSAALLCVSTSALGITLPESPADGARLRVVDVAGNAATANITIDPNGMQIEGTTASVVLATNGINRSWIFDAATGNWRRSEDLALEDDLPFPASFHYGWGLRLAKRMSEYGQALSKEDDKLADECWRLMRARYVKPGLLRPDGAISSMGGASRYGFASWDGSDA